MRRFYLIWSVVVLSLCLASSLIAQAPVKTGSPAATTATVPALDDLDKAWVQNVMLAQQLANKDCQGLESVKAFMTLQADIVKKIEGRHPGFKADLAKGVLVAK